MSYDVYVYCSTCRNDLMYDNNNMTSNISAVWNAAGAPLKDWDGKQGFEVLPELQRAINELTRTNMLPYERENYEALARGDGSWGQWTDAAPYLMRIRDAICIDPKARIEVSR